MNTAALVCCLGAFAVVIGAVAATMVVTKVLLMLLNCDEDGMTCRCGGEFELVKERHVMATPDVGVRKWKCSKCGAELVERFCDGWQLSTQTQYADQA